MVNIQIYAMADKYDIPGLMTLAVRKFRDRIQDSPRYNFAEILSSVIESTYGKDNGLHLIISELCVKYKEDILGFKDVEDEAIHVKVIPIPSILLPSCLN